MKITKAVRTAAILALAALAVSDVRADDDAPAPVVTATISVASYDKIKEMSDLVGVPLPPALSPDGIEQALPFIGVGKFRVDAPLGMAFLFGKDLNAQQQGFFFLPMLPGGAPLTNIPNATTTDAPDTIVAGNGMPFRRTTDFLLFGGTVPTTSKYDTAKITDLYKPTKNRAGKTITPLFRCDVDVKAMKAVDPDKVNDFLDKNTDDDSQTPDQKKGAEWAKNYMKTGVDRFDLDVDQIGDDHLSVSTRIAPLHVDTAPLQRPGLPDDCLLRADLRIRFDSFQKLYDLTEESKRAKPEDKATTALLGSVYLGQAETFGLGEDGADPVFYEIVQRTETTDVVKAIRDYVAQWNKSPQAEQDPDGKIELTEYKTADGTVVQRMKTRGLDPGSSKLFFDTCAVGKVVYVAAAEGDKHLVEKLVGLKPAGKFDDVASGWVKPKESSKLLKKLAEEKNIPEEVMKLIGQMGTDPLQWHADNDGDGIRFTVEFPREILWNLGPAMGAGN